MQTTFGVLFDMDGVLVDSNPVHKQAIRQFCDRYGKTLTSSFFYKYISGRTNSEWIPVLFKDISAEQVRMLADEKERLFRDMFHPREHVLPGLFSFLRMLDSRSIPMAVATSAPSENTDYILSGLDVTGYFDAVLNASHVRVGKPDPDIYLKSAKAIGLPPSLCIVIEDSVAGVRAGKRAGAKVIGVTSTHNARELDYCDLLVKDFKSLSIERLEQLFREN